MEQLRLLRKINVMIRKNIVQILLLWIAPFALLGLVCLLFITTKLFRGYSIIQAIDQLQYLWTTYSPILVSLTALIGIPTILFLLYSNRTQILKLINKNR